MHRKILITGIAVSSLMLSACGGSNGDGSSGTDSIGSIGSLGDGDGDGDMSGDGDGDGDGNSGNSGNSGDGDGDGDGDGNSGGGIKFDVGDGIVGGQGGNCEEVEISGEPEPPDIMFILDRSCSMGSGTRWSDLQTAVDFIVTNYSAQANFGSRAYPPIVGTDNCTNYGVDVAMGPGMTTGPAIVNLLANNGPTGSTPTSPAVTGSIQHLQSLTTTGDKLNILIADGNVNGCNSAASIATEIATAYNGGNDPSIPTYVVAVGGVTSTNFDTWAASGGTGSSYNTSSLSTLQTALDGIIAGVISCTVKLDPPPDYPDLVEVTVDGVTYTPLADASACGDGFYYTNSNFDEIELCGAACNDLKTELSADITYKCGAG